MKTIEEKAKAYDESLERAKEQLNGAKVFDYDNEQIAHDIRTTVYNIFPELKESEDEKIRKALINFFDGWGNKTWDSGIKYSEVVVWLQKQGEHANFRNKIQIGDKLTRNDNGELVNLSQLERVAKKLEKQEEQKSLYIRFGDIPNNEKSKIYRGEEEIGEENGVSVYPAFESNGDIVIGLTLPITRTSLHTQQHLLEYDNRPCYLVSGDCVGKGTDGEPLIRNICTIKQLSNYRIKEIDKQGEQKATEWSEEDEYSFAFIQEALLGLDGDNSYREKCCKMAEWLESLKERVQPQTKQEWGEEDEINYNYALAACKYYGEAKGYTDTETHQKTNNWLKNLKDRYTWKPTKNQIDALFAAVYLKALRNTLEKDSVKQLEELYNQLKKLKE